MDSQFLISTQQATQRKPLTTKQGIEAWLAEYKIENYVIADDLSVSVEGSVFIDKPMPYFLVNFTTITGPFECKKVGLRSLEGAPSTVGSDFDIGHNQITTLQYGPRKVEGCFKASNNQLKSLAFSPEEVGMYFADSNPLETLLDFNTQEIAKGIDDDDWHVLYLTVDPTTSSPIYPILSYDDTLQIKVSPTEMVYVVLRHSQITL